MWWYTNESRGPTHTHTRSFIIYILYIYIDADKNSRYQRARLIFVSPKPYTFWAAGAKNAHGPSIGADWIFATLSRPRHLQKHSYPPAIFSAWNSRLHGNWYQGDNEQWPCNRRFNVNICAHVRTSLCQTPTTCIWRERDALAVMVLYNVRARCNKRHRAAVQFFYDAVWELRKAIKVQL